MGHRDIFGQCHVPWHQPQCKCVEVWQGPAGKVSGYEMRQFGLAGPFPELKNGGDEQQIDHAAAGIPPRQVTLQNPSGFRVFGAGKQVVAGDRVAQGLRFAAQSMDDMVVVDDMNPVAPDNNWHPVRAPGDGGPRG